MGKFDTIIKKYATLGVSNSNLEFATEAVEEGTQREHILETLTADYRGMNNEQATALLEELFIANGGEFKKENRGGYLYGMLFLILGGICSFFICESLIHNEILPKPILFWSGAIVGIGGAFFYFSKALRGKYREGDNPSFFND